MLVGRYRIVRRIASGAMGELLEATAIGESGFERRVAIKRLHEKHREDPSQQRMFLDEARIASHLHHANVVSILDYGIADGMPFQVLEYVDGIDTKQAIIRIGELGLGHFPVEIALYVATEIAHALAHAHEARDPDGRLLGIVHRDVKPANIIVDWSGDVFLTDFGIAFAEQKAEKTKAGLTRGTMAYMSPEQFFGQKLDGKSDLFALGCVLHALLTSKSPITDRSTISEMLAGKALALSPDLPEDVLSIISRATESNATDRYADAEEMGEALGAALAHRIKSDPKSLLRSWLKKLHATPAPAVGQLDALLNVEMLLKSSEEGVRCFETCAAADAEKKENVPTTVLLAEAPQKRSLWLPVFVAAAGLLLGGVIVLFSRPDPEEEIRASTWPTPLQQVDASSPAEKIESSTTSVALAPPARKKTKKRKRQRRPKPAVVSQEKPSKPLLTTTVRRGYVLIGGAGAHRAEIFVGGRSLGYAPKRLTLSLGKHEVLLVRPDGTKVGPTPIEVTSRNTYSAPHRLMVR